MPNASMEEFESLLNESFELVTPQEGSAASNLKNLQNPVRTLKSPLAMK